MRRSSKSTALPYPGIFARHAKTEKERCSELAQYEYRLRADRAWTPGAARRWPRSGAAGG